MGLTECEPDVCSSQGSQGPPSRWRDSQKDAKHLHFLSHERSAFCPFLPEQNLAQKDTQLSLKVKDMVNLGPDGSGIASCPSCPPPFPPVRTTGLHFPVSPEGSRGYAAGSWPTLAGGSDLCLLQDGSIKPPAQPSTVPGHPGRVSSSWRPEWLWRSHWDWLQPRDWNFWARESTSALSCWGLRFICHRGLSTLNEYTSSSPLWDTGHRILTRVRCLCLLPANPSFSPEVILRTSSSQSMDILGQHRFEEHASSRSAAELWEGEQVAWSPPLRRAGGPRAPKTGHWKALTRIVPITSMRSLVSTTAYLGKDEEASINLECTWKRLSCQKTLGQTTSSEALQREVWTERQLPQIGFRSSL